MNNTEHSQVESTEAYNFRMSKSIMDKLFWIDKIFDVDVIVDYGAADGTLIDKALPWFDDDVKFVPWDRNPEMNKIYDDKYIDSEIVKLLYHFNEIQNFIKNKQSAVICSSLIHEVYHYSSPKQIDKFWDRIFGNNFDYVIIRDMIPSMKIDRPADTNDVSKVYKQFLHKRELKDFESKWGSIKNNKNLIHFLLKYRYTEPNWEREVKENYLPLYYEDMLAKIPNDYSILHHHHYILPYIKNQIQNDFGIELKDNTHLKLILKKDA